MGVPACSACGQTVDYLRSCHVGSWRLFSDSTALVQGRYYFSPPDAPVYLGEHIYGSRTWDGTRFEIAPEFGEVRGTPAPWIPGEEPNEMPDPAKGSHTCIAGPQPVSQAIPYADTLEGFPVSCLGLPIGTQKWHRFASYKRSIIQLLWSWVICEVYDDNRIGIIDLLSELLDEDIVYTFIERQGRNPRTLFAICPRYAIVVSEGTANEEQIFHELYGAGVGPQNQGQYSTHPIFQSGATRNAAALTAAGYVPGTPIFVAGHSLGGAVNMVLVAMLRIGRGDTLIRYFTVGSPAIGDQRIVNLVTRAEGANMANTADPVPGMPFGLGDMGAAIPFVGFLFATSTLRWKHGPNSDLQHSDGRLELRARWVPASTFITNLLVQISLNQPIAPFAAHSIYEYIRRIALRAPGPSYPIYDPLVYATLRSCVQAVSHGPVAAGGPAITMLGRQPFGDNRFYTGGSISGNPYGTAWYFRMSESITPAPLAASVALGMFFIRIGDASSPIPYKLTGVGSGNLQFVDVWAGDDMNGHTSFVDEWNPGLGDPWTFDLSTFTSYKHIVLVLFWDPGDALSVTFVVDPV